MAFAITKSCCTDASCVSVCPVGCIHPAPGEPGFGTSEILHIDPQTCIDCGACADACPVDAIFPVDRLSDADRVYAEINAAYRLPQESAPALPEARRSDLGVLRHRLEVAVIGSGPAGMYTVRELLSRTQAHITVFDALPTPGGLVRSGIAADHPRTKRIQRTFDLAMRHPRVDFVGGVCVGSDASLAEVRSAFDATFLAVGARTPRRLGVPGEDRPEVLSALEVASWAGGEPGHDRSPVPVDVPGRPRRAVVVGTGNVALDVVRLFTLPPEQLATTDLADRALDVLRTRPIRDVVVLGRGTTTQAAYTEAEYRALAEVPDLEVRVLDAEDRVDSLSWEEPDHPRVTFVFGTTVERFAGDPALLLTTARPGASENPEWACTFAVTSIGHTVSPIDDVVLDPLTGAVANDRGRLGPGLYAVGWAKRGASGGIGANRQCAQESVDTFLEHAAGDPRSTRSPDHLRRALRQSGIRTVDRRGSTRIDRAERRAGEPLGRPRVKLTTLDDLRASARTRPWSRRAS